MCLSLVTRVGFSTLFQVCTSVKSPQTCGLTTIGAHFRFLLFHLFLHSWFKLSGPSWEARRFPDFLFNFQRPQARNADLPPSLVQFFNGMLYTCAAQALFKSLCKIQVVPYLWNSFLDNCVYTTYLLLTYLSRINIP